MPMFPPLQNSEILLRFDHLVATKHVFFGPSKVVRLVDQWFPVSTACDMVADCPNSALSSSFESVRLS